LHSVQLARRGWKGIFDALKIADFRKYWLSLFVLNFGGQMLMPAQSWLAYELTGSPLKLTLVMAMQSIPWFLLSLYSGVISDRIQKERDVIIACQMISTFVAAIIAVLIATGKIEYWHLLVSSFFIAASTGRSIRPPVTSIMAELVPRGAAV
jgi:MFS family permease